MRNFGLDIYRSIAILLVLICHGLSTFLFNHDVYGIMYATGFLGVELFFVLSGYLIGKIIIRTIYQDVSWTSLLIFYFRRWCRTLPLYFLILIVLMMVEKKIMWEYIFFVQNYNEPTLSFFPVSWSLSIEEWFYLLIPLAFVFLSKSIKQDKLMSSFFIFSFSMIFVFIFLKFYFYYQLPTWDFHTRKQIYLRMDSLMVGVVVAGVKIYYKELYSKIAQNSIIFVGSLLGITYFGLYFINREVVEGTINSNFFARTFLFTIVSILSAIIMIQIECSRFILMLQKKTWLAKCIRTLSLTSYSVYMVHIFVYNYFSKFLDESTEDGFRLLLWFSAVIVVYVISCTSFKIIEQPILRLRDKYFVSKAP